MSETVDIQQTLPFAELKKEDLGKNREVIRDNATRSEEIWSIDLDKILIRPGFNVRDYLDPVLIREKAASIVENGQITPGRVDILKDGCFYLEVGHYRYAALLYMRDHLGITEKFKTTVNNRETTDEERITRMWVSNDGVELTQNEKAKTIFYLKAKNISQKDIAAKLRVTPAYVSQMLTYYAQPDHIKNRVISGEISAANVVKLVNQFPSQELLYSSIDKFIKNIPVYPEAKPDTNTLFPGLTSIPEVSDAGTSSEEDEENNDQDDNSKDDTLINKHENFVSSEKKEIDTQANASGEAIIEKKQLEIKATKREIIEALCKVLIERFDMEIEIDTDDYIDMYNIIDVNFPKIK